MNGDISEADIRRFQQMGLFENLYNSETSLRRQGGAGANMMPTCYPTELEVKSEQYPWAVSSYKQFAMITHLVVEPLICVFGSVGLLYLIKLQMQLQCLGQELPTRMRYLSLCDFAMNILALITHLVSHMTANSRVFLWCQLLLQIVAEVTRIGTHWLTICVITETLVAFFCLSPTSSHRNQSSSHTDQTLTNRPQRRISLFVCITWTFIAAIILIILFFNATKISECSESVTGLRRAQLEFQSAFWLDLNNGRIIWNAATILQLQSFSVLLASLLGIAYTGPIVVTTFLAIGKLGCCLRSRKMGRQDQLILLFMFKFLLVSITTLVLCVRTKLSPNDQSSDSDIGIDSASSSPVSHLYIRDTSALITMTHSATNWVLFWHWLKLAYNNNNSTRKRNPTTANKRQNDKDQNDVEETLPLRIPPAFQMVSKPSTSHTYVTMAVDNKV